MALLPGLDLYRSGSYKKFRDKRIGLLSNQASVTSDLVHARDVVSKVSQGSLTALFGPQHGYAGEDQDNMIETGHSFDKDLRIPIFSLYSNSREPSADMMGLIDVLLVDMQDVGTRVYTFSSTMLNCMRAAKKHNVKIVVLDRPNPLGGEVMEGNLLETELYSFVGLYRMPMRHGMTMGELALMFNKELKVGCDLSVIRMEGWNRSMFWEDTGLPWAVPSPNMPIPESAYVYPGQVIWEGTNLSEGRGTCRPFETFGAPYLDTGRVKGKVPAELLKGCLLREISFKPTFNKWQGEICRGFMIHILDRDAFRPYETAIAILHAVIETHKECFEWKSPPYEYEYEKLPIDLILGNYDLRLAIQEGRDIFDIRECWLKGYEEFKELRRPYLLY